MHATANVAKSPTILHPMQEKGKRAPLAEGEFDEISGERDEIAK